MKKKLRNRFASFLLAVVFVLCASVPANAVSPVQGWITDSDLFIGEEAAKYIAEFFVRDMIETGTTCWNSETAVTGLVPLYDETGENVVSYTAELTQGYLVISAYADVPSIVLEWSDEAEPVYEEFQLTESAKIIYSGGLSYYLDQGDALETIGGTAVSRSRVKNTLKELRSREYLSTQLKTQIFEAKLFRPGISTYDNNYKGDAITDVYTYAQNVYGGTWKADGWVNNWEDYKYAMTYHSVSEYSQACAPIALTNAIKMYGDKYGITSIRNTAGKKIFEVIKDLKYGFFNNLYYWENGVGMVDPNYIGDYAKDAFAKYGKTITVSDFKNITAQNAISTCSAGNKLMLLCLSGNDHLIYDYHTALGYAYNRIKASNQSTTKSFIKLCDGHSSGPRYLDISLISLSQYIELIF